MKFVCLLAITVFLLPACQSKITPTVQIIDNNQVITLHTQERDLAALLAQAGITLNLGDRILLNGLPIGVDQPMPNPSIDFAVHPIITLQLRRAVAVTLDTQNSKQIIYSSAFTIGEGLQEASLWLHAGDRIIPSLTSPITSTPILITSPREFTIHFGGKSVEVVSSAQTVGAALAEAGMPLIGLDYSLPAENEPLPADGQIRLVRVTESLQLAQKPIAFENELQASADVPLDQTQILQPGELGLTVQRIRIRYEYGEEVSRLTEDETLVRPPKTRLMGYGTKVEVKTATVDGVQIEYWRAVQMYATSYSPCRSGGDRCYTGTASGESLRKGMVGLRPDLYQAMQGQRLYIPGYGFASVEDVCGGCVGQPWIDLGFTDANFEPWHSWVTVYFLTPVPPHVIYILE